MPQSEEKTIFNAARQLGTAEARCAYIAQACGGDGRLRARVDALLRVLDADRHFLESPADLFPATVDNPIGEGPGSIIGPYELLEPIGEGGFGVVFLAEQQQPIRRQVALKVIKPGMDTRQVIARFEAERQALALMDHPNIARVLDAGATNSGRPYFVMELVRGVPITEYCNRESLSLPERLDLFIHACQAVQHAHQKGIIHRDIKPSNVLVTLHDGAPVVKIIDFGIAKAMDRKLTDRAMSTQFAALVGTPLYMSPEQLERGGLDIDTRTDIYALGALLYELLTGATPFDRERMQMLGIDEIRRIIREEEPPKPSTRLRKYEGGRMKDENKPKRIRLLDFVSSFILHPSSFLFHPSSLQELDWIVMKCLEKDRTRRYETANGLARDVQRYLADEPVAASPPSTAYRLQKFLHRNRGPVLAAGLVVLALAGGIVGTIIGLVQADEARRAEAHRAESERLAKDTAEKRLAQLEKGMDIIGAIFENLDPRSEDKEGRSLRAMLGDRLEQAAAVLEGDSVGDPLVVARLQDRLGQTYLGLGDTAKAEALFARALTTRQDLLGPEHPQTLASMHSQAMAFKAAGKLPQAIERFEQVRDAQIKELGADHPDTLTTLNNLGVAYRFAGKLPEAIALLKQVGEARADKLGADDPDTLITLNWLAWAYRDDGRLDDAIVLHRHVLDARVKRLGRDDPDTLGTMDELALAYRAADNPSAAIALYEQARDARMKRYGLDHPRTLTTLNNLAWTYRIAGRTSEAIALFEHIRDIRVQKLEAENLDALTTLGDLAWAYANAGKREQAISVFQRAAVGLEKRKFAHKDAGAIIGRMCECQEYLKKHAEAEVWRRKWLAVLKEKSGADSIDYAEASAALGWNLVQQQKWVEVEMVLRPCLSVRQHNEADAWTTFDTQLLLGTALVGQHKYADAEPHLLQGYQGLKAREAKMPDHARGDLTRDLEQLVNLYDSAGMQAEADRWRKELEQRKTK